MPMNIRNSLSKRFQRLRWRLTLSYTGVTVGVLLVIGVISIIVSTLVLVNMFNQGVVSDQLIEVASISTSPPLTTAFTDPAPKSVPVSSFV